MINNLRSKPIEGHVADSAGNILRNANIIIKQSTPNGAYVVDSTQSDDDGYFVSGPLSNGTYDIYESGTKISRIIHSPDSLKIQCFQANADNFDLSIMGDFNELATSLQLNKYYGFIQLESQLIDIYQYGNLFPIYDIDILSNRSEDDFNELYALAYFYQFSSKSRITTTRFDIEYFAPLTIASNLYKRIRWAGVPAIKFYQDSRLVIPLDYYSIVMNNPKAMTPNGSPLGSGSIAINADNDNAVIQELSGENLLNLSYLIAVGDILRIKMTSDGTDIRSFNGIITSISPGTVNKTIYLEKWKSSRFVSDVIPNNAYVRRIFAFDGMFSNIMSINEDINQRFTIVENISAQNNQSELYNYITT